MRSYLQSYFEKYRLRYELFGLFLLGGAGVLVFGQHGPFHVVYFEHLSMAVSISGFVAFFIEVALHQQFAKNVFEASIGYLFPEELRDELRWIANLEFLCEKHTQITHVTHIEGTDRVIAETEVTRVFRNITAVTKLHPPGLGVWERFFDGYPSKILSYTTQLEGEDRGPNLATNPRQNSEKGPVLTIGDYEKIAVKSGKTVTFSMVYQETLCENDWIYLHFGNPTCDVTVIVHAPDDLEIDVRFSHRESDPKIAQIGPHTWHLKGALLPLQAIRIYMFRKDKFEAWKNSFK